MRKVAAVVLAGLVLAGCAMATRVPVLVKPLVDPGGEGEFTFVVMGDNRPWWGGKDNVFQNEYFAENIRGANASGGEFVVITGDLIHGYSKDMTVVNRMWDDFDRATSYFELPVVPVVGNHDIQDRKSAGVYKRRIGPTVFSWDYRGCHYIALDSEVVGGIDRIAGAQLAWLKEDLKRAGGARRLFVFVHKPLWRFGPRERWAENRWNREVHPLLAAAGVDTVFAGHDHEYQRYPTRDGVNYVVTGGAGAEVRGGELEGAFFHYLVVSVKGHTSSYEVITPDGRVPVDYVTTQSLEAHELDLNIEPLASLPKDGLIEMRARLKNPVASEARVTVTWDTKGTAWLPIGRKAVLAALRPNDEAAFAIQAHVTGRLFPLPSLKVELADDTESTELLSWNVFTQALAKIAPMAMEWNVVGPFDLGEPSGADALKTDQEEYLLGWLPGWDGMLPPEKGVDLAAVYRGKDGKKIRWETLKADKRGIVDLAAAYTSAASAKSGKPDKPDKPVNINLSAACAVTYVYSPAAGFHDFTCGSDDSILVRVNGEEVWYKHAKRAFKTDEDYFSAWLKEGWNEVLVKIGNYDGNWAFCLRVLDAEGSLKFALQPGAGAAVAKQP